MYIHMYVCGNLFSLFLSPEKRYETLTWGFTIFELVFLQSAEELPHILNVPTQPGESAAMSQTVKKGKQLIRLGDLFCLLF